MVKGYFPAIENLLWGGYMLFLIRLKVYLGSVYFVEIKKNLQKNHFNDEFKLKSITIYYNLLWNVVKYCEHNASILYKGLIWNASRYPRRVASNKNWVWDSKIQVWGNKKTKSEIVKSVL